MKRDCVFIMFILILCNLFGIKKYRLSGSPCGGSAETVSSVYEWRAGVCV